MFEIFEEISFFFLNSISVNANRVEVNEELKLCGIQKTKGGGGGKAVNRYSCFLKIKLADNSENYFNDLSIMHA